MPSPIDPFKVGEDNSPISGKPDLRTAQFPFFEGGAPNQIFMFDRWGVKYGTDDKGHAASIILSVLLLILLSCLFVLGTIWDRDWIVDAIQILGTAFTLVAGVAIGKSTADK